MADSASGPQPGVGWNGYGSAPSLQKNKIMSGGKDWSLLMTELLRSLTSAEESLRLLHADPLSRSKAVGHLIVARHALMELEEWCEDGKERV